MLDLDDEVLAVAGQWVTKAENDLTNAAHTVRLRKACPTDTVCNFWPDPATGAWTVPTAAQRELLRRRRARPQQLALGLEVAGEQMGLGLR